MRKETTMGNGQFSLQKRNLSSEKKQAYNFLIDCKRHVLPHVQCTCHQSNETKQQWAFYLSLQWVEVWDTFPVLEIHWSEKTLNKCAVPKKYPYPSSGRYSGLTPPPPPKKKQTKNNSLEKVQFWYKITFPLITMDFNTPSPLDFQQPTLGWVRIFIRYM